MWDSRWAAGVLALSLSGCSTCDRDGCDAMGQRAGNDGTSAIAGAVAGESDVIENGCQSCGFSSVDLSIWKTDGRVSDAASVDALTHATPATFQFRARERYRQTLDAGFYLLCISFNSCVSVQVSAGQVTTVNVLQVFGPTSFYVAEAGAADLTRTSGVGALR